jgi:hypothetical protein
MSNIEGFLKRKFSRRGYSETVGIFLFSNCRLIFTLLFQRCCFYIHVFGLSIFQLFSYIGIYIYFTIDTVLFYFFNHTRLGEAIHIHLGEAVHIRLGGGDPYPANGGGPYPGGGCAGWVC